MRGGNQIQILCERIISIFRSLPLKQSLDKCQTKRHRAYTCKQLTKHTNFRDFVPGKSATYNMLATVKMRDQGLICVELGKGNQTFFQ